MMNKALRLIAAAERDLDEEAKGINIKRGNPFGRPCGLQTDGDLWQQAWLAVKSRGIGTKRSAQLMGMPLNRMLSMVPPLEKTGKGMILATNLQTKEWKKLPG